MKNHHIKNCVEQTVAKLELRDIYQNKMKLQNCEIVAHLLTADQIYHSSILDLLKESVELIK